MLNSEWYIIILTKKRVEENPVSVSHYVLSNNEPKLPPGDGARRNLTFGHKMPHRSLLIEIYH